MAGFNQTPRFLLRLINLPPRILYAVGLGPVIGKMILLLTTSGRKTGKKRVTPLQYEEIDGKIYAGSALGQKADWVVNIQNNPRVEVRVKSKIFLGRAELIADTKQITDFLEERLRRHPKMIGAILRSDGIRKPYERKALEEYAAKLTLVVIRPDTGIK